jgi:hypothetical protein
LEKLATSYAAKPYDASVPGAYNTKKCIDLYVSADLDAALRKTQKR